jgi:hypothetical protein
MSSKALLQATFALRMIFGDLNQPLLKAVSKGIFAYLEMLILAITPTNPN